MDKNLIKKESILPMEKKISKEVDIYVDKFNHEILRCVSCPILMHCKCTKKKLDALREEAKKISEEIYEEEIELDDSADNVLRAQNKRDYTYQSYIENNAYKVLKNDRCMFEKREVINILQRFVNAGYDITDPRANLIISELIGNMLNSGRANKAFTALGVILKKDTPAGPVYYQNPLLKTKMEFSKLIIEATEALDRILKSDEQQKAEKSFTDHLLNSLKIREQKRAKIIDVENSNEVLEYEEKDDK